ncbi:MAG: hypothetical protein K8E66_05635 [Phycisphaerales bacterium]|nr:hypothetical protein [Phycisphaerales bacterium]
MIHAIRTTTMCLIAGACGTASADSVVLNIDPGQSSINVTATLSTPVGDDTDSASSPISGTIEIELDNYGAPASITLHDFVILLDNDVSMDFDYGFLGDATATLINAIAMYATPGFPTGPVAVTGTSFSFLEVPSALAGSYTYAYDFFLVVAYSGTGDLADFGVFASPISGDVTSDGSTVTLSGSLDIDATQTVIDGIADLTLVGAATIVATGEAPQPAGCNAADIAEPFGVLDLGDISAFVTAFVAQDPVADLAPPAGVFDLADLGAFVSAFIGGCP